MNPISVVISTREINDDYLKHVSKVFSHPKTEIIVYENQGEYSLPELYNKGLQDSSNEIDTDELLHDCLNAGGEIPSSTKMCIF